MSRFYLSVLFASILLAGCAETELASHWLKKGSSRSIATASNPAPNSTVLQQKNNFKIGTPYRIEDKWYTPAESYSYDETGISSWYGDQFHGKRTANGEIFDKNALTAAHPTLQLPSLIRVTNLQNGLSTVLRVNDRGPFAKSRLIDVSHQAARVLGFENQGTARVRIQVLEKESRILAEAARKGYSPSEQMAMAYNREVKQENVQVASNQPFVPANMPTPVTSGDIEDLNKKLFRKYPVSPTSLYIQVGSFSNAANAQSLKQKLNHLGAVNVYPTTVNGQQFNRVRIGPIASVPQADKILNTTIKSGYPQAHIIVD